MSIGFTGTQRGLSGAQYETLRSTLWSWSAGGMGLCLHHGDCIGADAAFHAMARSLRPSHSVWIVGHIPEFKGKRAFCDFDEELSPLPYLVRNHAIVDASDALFACPGEMEEQLRSGTWATVRYARKQGKRVLIFWPDGTQS